MAHQHSRQSDAQPASSRRSGALSLLPRFPRKWFDRFAYFDEIWVASSFIADSLSAVSPIPIVRLPPPLMLPASGSRERGRQRLGLADDELMFLFAFDFHSHIERKNP